MTNAARWPEVGEYWSLARSTFGGSNPEALVSDPFMKVETPLSDPWSVATAKAALMIAMPSSGPRVASIRRRPCTRARISQYPARTWKWMSDAYSLAAWAMILRKSLCRSISLRWASAGAAPRICFS